MTAIMTKVGSELWNIKKTIVGIIVLEPTEASVHGLGTGQGSCFLLRC